MEPYSIPSVPAHLSTRGDDPSSASEEARRDQRRVENSRATAFRTAMERSTGAPTPSAPSGRPVITGWNSGQADSKGQAQVSSSGLRKGSAGTSLPKQDQALSPSLLKLRAATARTAGPTQPHAPTSAPQLPVPGKNLGVPCPGEQPVHPNATDIPLPPAPPRHPKLRYDLAALSTAEQMPLPQAINPAAESARLEARASGHDGDKKDNSGTSEESAPVDSGSDRSGLPLPVPTVTPQPPPCESPQAERIMPPTPLLQQVVEFATVAPNQQGFMEFRLGLSRNALGGMRIRVCAYGNRRVGLNVKCGEGDGAIHEGHLAGLIDALRQRNVEVVDTVFE